MKKSLFALPLLALASACHGSHKASGTVGLIVTDAPVSFEEVQSATLQIDRVTIDGGAFSLAAPRVLYKGAPVSVELTSLRNGAARLLFSRKLPVGTYRRLHVHITGGELQLTGGRTFSTADGSMQLPQTESTGFEVTIETPLEVTADHWSRLMVDIDVPRSFLPQGSEEFPLATSVLLQPLLHAVRPGQTGEIRGLVTQADKQGHPAPVADATLFFLPAGTQDLELAAGSTGTDADGSYTKLGLPPGTYDVLVQKAGASATSNSCLVTAAGYSIVDINLP
ncbi:MAG: DUF4382 domain-containing protein [Planctomycetes bacterium]|nr:DUF4382 domain-containing protein [Planctomycetota bacterium]